MQASVEEKAARGDRAALGELLRAHAAPIQRLCYFVVGPTEAADLGQASLERVIVGISKFDPSRGSFRSWALGVARNVCLDHLRRRGLERAAFADGGDDVVERTATDSTGPEATAMARVDAAALQTALATLPEGMRTAVVLFHLQDASYQEIAVVLGVPVGTVMTWLHRGRHRLRLAIGEGNAPVSGGGTQS